MIHLIHLASLFGLFSRLQQSAVSFGQMRCLHHSTLICTNIAETSKIDFALKQIAATASSCDDERQTVCGALTLPAAIAGY